MSGGGFDWEGELLVRNISQLDRKIKRAMVAAAGRTAAQSEGWMKSNARWTDRTGNARNGLTARAQTGDDSVSVVLAHSVPYGIYLELRWDGRYAII